MGKESKTIRIDSNILGDLLDKAELENRSLSNVIETICYNYFSTTSRKELIVNGFAYMPIHMNNEDLYNLFQEMQLIVPKIGNCSTIKVKKHHGSKGVAFSIDYFYLDDEGAKNIARRYTFSIDPNWEILDFFDHWTKTVIATNEKKKMPFASEKINVSEKTKSVIRKIQNDMVKRGKPKIHPIFNSHDWTEIYYNYEKFPLNE